jgi:hypothetical protein
MNRDLQDDAWMHCGISLVWDAASINRVCSPELVCSLRGFLRLNQANWPEDTLNLVNNRTLVVGGLDAAMDTLHPDDACDWLEKNIYPAVRDFQESVADGGREAALILWLADGKRVFHQASDNTYHWHCSGEHRQRSIPIGRCIWNGAEGSVHRLIASDGDKKMRHIGLFLQRIS